ncbi:MAG TPA: glycosyltransferase family 4 protein [Candidatus Saccharimonadales bacterium]
MSDRRKPILFLSHLAGTASGAELSLLETVRYLKANTEFDPVVIIPAEGTLYEALRALGCKVYVLSYNWWTDDHPTSSTELQGITRHNARAIEQINFIISTLRPVACITNTMVAPWLAYASALQKVPHVWQLTEFGTSAHAIDFILTEDQVLRTVNELSDKIIVNSLAMQRHYAALLPRHRQSIDVAYPYVAPPPAAPSISPGAESDSFNLVAVGHIKPSKGQLDAVQALQVLRDAHGISANLCLVGSIEDEAYFKKIKSFITKHKLTRLVQFAGYSSQPHQFLRRADIALVCATNEAFGRVAIEPPLAGVPVIGTRSGGVQETIDDGKTGLLYEPGNITELVKSILHFKNDPVFAATTVDAAQRKYYRLYALDKVHQPLVAYLRGIPAANSLDLRLLGGIFTLNDEYEQKLTKLANEALALKAAHEQLMAIKNSRKWRLVSKIGRGVAAVRNLLSKIR